MTLIVFLSPTHIMKLISLVLVLVSLLSASPVFSQDCKLLRETDPYTREAKLSTGFIALQNASVTIDADSKEIDFFFTLPDKCFEDESTIFIFFEGTRTRTTYRNQGSMNCDGYFHFKYKNTESPNFVLKKLASMKVTQFVFLPRDKKEVTIALLPDQQEALMKAADCIIKEGNGLIKK